MTSRNIAPIWVIAMLLGLRSQAEGGRKCPGGDFARPLSALIRRSGRISAGVAGHRRGNPPPAQKGKTLTEILSKTEPVKVALTRIVDIPRLQVPGLVTTAVVEKQLAAAMEKIGVVSPDLPAPRPNRSGQRRGRRKLPEVADIVRVRLTHDVLAELYRGFEVLLENSSAGLSAASGLPKGADGMAYQVVAFQDMLRYPKGNGYGHLEMKLLIRVPGIAKRRNFIDMLVEVQGLPSAMAVVKEACEEPLYEQSRALDALPRKLTVAEESQKAAIARVGADLYGPLRTFMFSNASVRHPIRPHLLMALVNAAKGQAESGRIGSVALEQEASRVIVPFEAAARLSQKDLGLLRALFVKVYETRLDALKMAEERRDAL